MVTTLDMPYTECPTAECGTLALMIGLGHVEFRATDETCQAVRVLWEVDGKKHVGYGTTWQEALKDCCERAIDG